ncbi:MAG: N-acetyl-gamma-glutamyl-phosphate reductase [Alphaproteobacteria bacterium]|nr:N-acetyl-gamma-glutamyl-phosphate reductase [Alphaproteobacteria bacterium]
MNRTANQVRLGILGASGYTGAELLRLLARHPGVQIGALTAEKNAGNSVADIFPHLGGLELPRLAKIADTDWDKVDAVFCCLPHATTQEVIGKLPKRLKVVDLSADFRIEDPELYAKWYGHPHQALDLQKDAVYGLTEHARDKVKKTRLCANPGCYPTSALLPLLPLVAAAQIDADDIVIDAKSGVSGAGREAKLGSLYGEVAEGIHAYGVASHRHTAEIEQELGHAAGRPITANFTPHLMPMSRGILSTIYVRLANGASAADLHATLAKRYAGEPFVRVLPIGQAPATRHVRGSNLCLIGVFADRVKGRAIVMGAIDNLVKGASGQAVQNFNIMHGFPETTALEQQPMFP